MHTTSKGIQKPNGKTPHSTLLDNDDAVRSLSQSDRNIMITYVSLISSKRTQTMIVCVCSQLVVHIAEFIPARVEKHGLHA
jgi:hypothetical protein